MEKIALDRNIIFNGLQHRFLQDLQPILFAKEAYFGRDLTYY